MSDFAKLIESLLPNYRGTKQDLAKAIGMTPSGFGRGVDRNTLSIENLLRLAKETGTEPRVIFRAAGKESVLRLMEDLFGQGQATGLNASEREILSQWRQLSAKGKEHLREFLRETLGPPAEVKGRKSA
jgi:hypothetical protein